LSKELRESINKWRIKKLLKASAIEETILQLIVDFHLSVQFGNGRLHFLWVFQTASFDVQLKWEMVKSELILNLEHN